jgi:hypothetical protein
MLDRDWLLTRVKAAAASADFTNYTASDLDHLYSTHTNILRMFMLDPELPLCPQDWPPPDQSWTNQASGINRFINAHGWSMHTNDRFFIGTGGVRTEPITGLPWPQIAGRRFPAVTHEGILYVVLDGFGPESGGVSWNPRTNRFDPTINGFSPLGGGWYYWKQTMAPPEPGWQRYEGEPSSTGLPTGAISTNSPTAR